MKKFAYALCLPLAALLVLSCAVMAYSAEDPPLTTPPVDPNDAKYFYGVFYNTLKKPSNPPIYNDWIFNGDPLSPKHWYNEKDWVAIHNTSSIPVTVYVYFYRTDGTPYNNDPVNGIPVTVQPYTIVSQTVDNFYDGISNNWDGNTPLEGLVRVRVPNNIGSAMNGTASVKIAHVLMKGNETGTFDPNARITTYTLDLVQISNKDNVHVNSGLGLFFGYITKNFNNNDKLDVSNEVVSFNKIANTSADDTLTVTVTYYDPTGGVIPLSTQDTFTIPARGSISYSPTAPSYGLNAAANDFVANSPQGTFHYTAVLEVTSPNKKNATIGQLVQLRVDALWVYDAVATNISAFTKQ